MWFLGDLHINSICSVFHVLSIHFMYCYIWVLGRLLSFSSTNRPSWPWSKDWPYLLKFLKRLLFYKCFSIAPCKRLPILNTWFTHRDLLHVNNHSGSDNWSQRIFGSLTPYNLTKIFWKIFWFLGNPVVVKFSAREAQRWQTCNWGCLTIMDSGN